MTRSQLLVSSMAGALAAAVVPISALLVLPPAGYGAFSFGYLVFSFGWSLQLSIICDSWARTRGESGLPSVWSNFWPPMMQLSLLAGVAAGVTTAVVFQEPFVAVLVSLSVALNLYRLGGRFYYSALGNRRLPANSDAATIIVFAATLAILVVAPAVEVLLAVSLAWATSSLAGASVFLPAKPAAGSNLRAWYRARKEVVHTLLGDSLLMDLGANAVPAVLAALLGARSFGVYRGISSVATPVQLILDPLRPTLAQLTLSTLAGRRYLIVVAGVASAMAAGCFVVLAVIIPQTGLASTTLGSLSEFAAACSIFVAMNFLGHFYYIASRNHLPRRELLAGRVLQTLAAIAGPLLGLFWGGLLGAIWGFVTASAISSASWMILVQSRNHRQGCKIRFS